MNKFILVLLIAVAFSATIEFDGSSLEGRSDWSDWLDYYWDWVSFFKRIPGYLKGIYKHLMDLGIIKKLFGYIEKYGKPKAVEYCKSFTGSDLCSDIVDYFFNFLQRIASYEK